MDFISSKYTMLNKLKNLFKSKPAADWKTPVATPEAPEVAQKIAPANT